ncbi:hypothetical protein CR513_53700, partial [Mucuna pruriens]
PRPDCRERVGLSVVEANSAFSLPKSSRHSTTLSACKTTKNPLIKLASLPGTQLTAVLPEFYDFVGNTHHFDNRGSTTSRGRNEIAAADNQRFEGYIDGCGMCGYVGHSFNDCPILQEPPQSVQESSLEDLMKQLAMNNSQFQKNVSTTQQPVQQLNSSPSLEDLVQQFQQNTMQIQQNNMQFQQNIIATVQELTAQIGQLATTINQLQFEDSGQVPSQAILSPRENISDIIVRSDMELP